MKKYKGDTVCVVMDPDFQFGENFYCFLTVRITSIIVYKQSLPVPSVPLASTSQFDRLYSGRTLRVNRI